MTTPTYYHLKENDYAQNFPDALDQAPVIIQKHTYIDDWIFNWIYAMITEIQKYIITHEETIKI